MRATLFALAGLMLTAATAAAQPADPALQGLAACAGVSDAAQKASCYDAAYGALNDAVRSGEVRLIRKQEAQAARRGAFGFNIPKLSVLDKAAKAEAPIENVVDEIKDARQDRDGRWTITLSEGAVWQQTETKTLSPRPKPGQKVEIKKGVAGSFFMKVADLPAVRARRVE